MNNSVAEPGRPFTQITKTQSDGEHRGFRTLLCADSCIYAYSKQRRPRLTQRCRRDSRAHATGMNLSTDLSLAPSLQLRSRSLNILH